MATPLRWQRKFSAVRSAVNSPRAGPSMVAMTSPGATTLPSGRSALSLMAGIDELKGTARDVEPGHDAGLARAQHQRGLLVGRHDRIRRDVAGAAEVFEQGGSHQRFVHEGQKWG